eukprot:scaffold257137_cov18-Tisochrysis_lutea.AAC.1
MNVLQSNVIVHAPKKLFLGVIVRALICVTDTTLLQKGAHGSRGCSSNRDGSSLAGRRAQSLPPASTVSAGTAQPISLCS